MRGGILVDEDGRFWPENARALMQRLDYRGSAAAFIIRALHLGCIHLQPNDSGARVAVSTGNFGRRALAGALYALTARAPRQVLLAALSKGEWNYCIFTSVADWGAHVENLAAGGAEDRRLLAIERPAAALAAWPTFRAMLPIVRLWRKTRGEFSEEITPTLMSAGLFNRSVLAREAPGQRLVWEHFGAGLTGLFRPCESLLQVGRDIDAFYDTAYGAWIAESYSRTFAGSQLRLETCDATLQRGRTGHIRLRYDRILIPWTYRCQRTAILGITIRRTMSPAL